jgi:predicted DNA-binding protein (MmcQ/YjbR family)
MKTGAASPAMKKIEASLREHAMAHPEATEALPWGELAVKVRGKAFLFLRAGEDQVSFSVKLPRTGAQALALTFTEPTGYGLGRHGWVTVVVKRLTKDLEAQCRAWIDESYVAVAPKSLTKVKAPKSSRAAPRA